jgi:hypothetical protein
VGTDGAYVNDAFGPHTAPTAPPPALPTNQGHRCEAT